MEKEQKAKSKPSFISDLIAPPALIPIALFHTPILPGSRSRSHAICLDPKNEFARSLFIFFFFFVIAKFDLDSSI